jgi:hypothetical protein
MKTTGGYVGAAIVFAALGAVALVAGVVEHRIARAEEMLMSLDFGGTTTAYDELAQYVDPIRYVPWIAGDAFDRVRARRAAARYWGGDYDALATVARDASGEGNLDVLFLTANSLYRLAQLRRRPPRCRVQLRIREFGSRRDRKRPAPRAARVGGRRRPTWIRRSAHVPRARRRAAARPAGRRIQDLRADGDGRAKGTGTRR